MTSRDFRAIAAILADNGATSDMVRAFADLLAGTNPRFDRDRFTAAATGYPQTAGDKPRARDYR